VAIDIAQVKDPVERVSRFETVGKYGADQVIECVGHPEAVNEGFSFAAMAASLWFSVNTPMRAISRSIRTPSRASNSG